MAEIGRAAPEEELEERQEDGQEDEQGDNPLEANAEVMDGLYVKVGPWYREWTTERLSCIMRQEGMKGMDAKLGISSWRNMIEAIGKQFLKHLFEFDPDDK